MKSSVVSVIVFQFICIITLAQPRVITGKVVDAGSQKALKNVVISIDSSQSKALTNYAGYFQLTVDSLKKQSITISRIGYAPLNIFIPTGNKFKFSLNKQYRQLEIVLEGSPAAKTDFGADDGTLDDTLASEHHAVFPGGMKNFYSFFENEIKKRTFELKKDRIEVLFTINEIGKATNITCNDSTESIYPSLKELVQSMPDWSPAAQQNEAVPQYFSLLLLKATNGKSHEEAMSQFYENAAQNMKYPGKARKLGIEKCLIMELSLDLNGDITRISFNDSDANTNLLVEEIQRVMSEMPRKLKQQLVQVTGNQRFLMPFVFKMNRNVECEEVKNYDGYIMSTLVVVGYGTIR